MKIKIKYICIISLILLIYLIIQYSKEYYETKVTLTEEDCKTWNNNKLNIKDNKVQNILTKRYITINSIKYKELDDMCKGLENANFKYTDRNIPSYLKILYELRNNVIDNYPCDPSKYNREKIFGQWIKSVDNECDTRSKVLYRENKGNLVFTPSRCNINNNCDVHDLKCTIYSGEWYPYTKDYFNTNESLKYGKLVDIDHTVPLKHAWISGACNWSPDVIYKMYTNDLTPGHLMSMPYYLNTEKGDKTPANWLPPFNELRYISNWIAVKYRYDLKLIGSEFNVLQNILEKYKDFKPDYPIQETEKKGDSLLKDKNIDLYSFDPVYKKERDLFIKNFENNELYDKKLNNLCSTQNTKFINTIFIKLKKELKLNKNHAYFGILRPEYIDLLTDNDICRLFAYI